MTWTTPTTRSTGDLITASIWNGDIVNNLAYLYGDTYGVNWGTFTFQNGWSNVGNAYYFRTGKMVYLWGTVWGGAPNTVFATMPVGYRPPTSEGQVTWTSFTTFGVLVVGADGTLTPQFTGGSTFNLAGVFWPVA